MNKLRRNIWRACALFIPRRGKSPAAGVRLHSEDHGGTLVETAMVLPMFLLFVFVVIAIGRVVYEYHAVVEAARQASRWAIVRGAQCYTNLASSSFCQNNGTGAVQADIKSYVTSLGYPGLTDSNVGVTAVWTTAVAGNNSGGATTTWTTCTSSCTTPGNMVAVTVTYNAFSIPIPMMKITPTFPLSSTSSMIISQ